MTEHEITKELLLFIGKAKEADSSISFIDMVLEFSEVREIDLHLIQEILSEDVYFKRLLMNDCISRGIVRTGNTKLEEW